MSKHRGAHRGAAARGLPVIRRRGALWEHYGGFVTFVASSPRWEVLLAPDVAAAALPDALWLDLADQFGPGRGNPHWTLDNLRAAVADAIAVYLDWEPEGERPRRLTTKALAARARQIALAARQLRLALFTVADQATLPELATVVRAMLATEAGRRVDWGEFQRSLKAAEDAATDVTLPRASQSGPREDPAFLGLVERLANLYAHWQHGDWHPTASQLPSMTRDPEAKRRAGSRRD